MKLVVMSVAATALNQELEESGEDLNANFGEWVNKLTRGIYVVFLSVLGPISGFTWFATIILNFSQITSVLDSPHFQLYCKIFCFPLDVQDSVEKAFVKYFWID